jgi:uncharacterized protein YdhG (YjbR/CyaY superfamily)
MSKNPSREAHFPAIEKRYGERMSYWFEVMSKIKDEKYPQQIAHLRQNYGFSQAHANALVMFSRGSTTAKRFETPDEYYKTIEPEQEKTMRRIFTIIQKKYPQSELVIAWNQPMLKLGNDYIFGMSAAKKHILIAPWSTAVLESFQDRLKHLDLKKKTIGIPNDWKVEEDLILDLVQARISETTQV